MPKEKYNWYLIKMQYCQGIWEIDPVSGYKTVRYPTVEELSEKYSIPKATIFQKSSKEQWTLERENYREKIEEYYDDVGESERAKLSARFDTENVARLEKLNRILDAYFDQYAPYYEGGYQGEELPKIDMKDMSYAISVMQSSHKLSRDIMNMYDRRHEKKEKKNTTKNDKIDKNQQESKAKQAMEDYLETNKAAEKMQDEMAQLRKMLGENND